MILSLFQQFIIALVACLILACLGVWVVNEKDSEVGVVIVIGSIIFAFISIVSTVISSPSV